MIMEKMLAIGKICNIHGVRGNIKLIPWTDFPEIFEQFEYIVIEGKKASIKYNSNIGGSKCLLQMILNMLVLMTTK